MFLVITEVPWHRVDLQLGVDVRSSLLIDWHLCPGLPHTIQINVGKAERRFLVRNVIALRQDGSPRVYDLSVTDISENQETSGTTGIQLAAPLKGADNSNRVNAPWRAPNLFGFACAAQRQQRRSHRFVFRSHGFEGESPNVLLQS